MKSEIIKQSEVHYDLKLSELKLGILYECNGSVYTILQDWEHNLCLTQLANGESRTYLSGYCTRLENCSQVGQYRKFTGKLVLTNE